MKYDDDDHYDDDDPNNDDNYEEDLKLLAEGNFCFAAFRAKAL